MPVWLPGLAVTLLIGTAATAYLWLIRRRNDEMAAGLHALSGLRWREFSRLVLDAMARRGLAETAPDNQGSREPQSTFVLNRDGKRWLLSCKHGSAYRIAAAPVVELAAGLVFYARNGAPTLDDKAKAQMTAEARGLLARVVTTLDSPSVDWTESTLEATVKAVAETASVKLGQVAQPLRAALTGSTVSPCIFEVLAILGRDESLTRLRAAAA